MLLGKPSKLVAKYLVVELPERIDTKQNRSCFGLVTCQGNQKGAGDSYLLTPRESVNGKFDSLVFQLHKGGISTLAVVIRGFQLIGLVRFESYGHPGIGADGHRASYGFKNILIYT